MDLDIYSGEYIAILGANGSGKSTFLSLLVGLLQKTSGDLHLYDETGKKLDPSSADSVYEARKLIGTVLQDSDDQIVGTLVEEDVAFGPENLGLSELHIKRRLAEALKLCDLEKLRSRPTHFLSGGEKQRLALAGVLALQPQVIALDEASSMIDPRGRDELLDLLDLLSASGRTLLHVTHSLDDASRAKRVLVLYKGRLVFDGSPARLFQHEDLEAWSLHLSDYLQFSRSLAAQSDIQELPQNPQKCAAFLKAALLKGVFQEGAPASLKGPWEPLQKKQGTENAEVILAFNAVSHEYASNSAFAHTALTELTFKLCAGTSLALVGETGSGKSTLLRHANAILLPSSGSVSVFGKSVLDKKTELRTLRLDAVLSVQNPESALFERYVGDDVAYGPRNKGLQGKSLAQTVRTAMDDAALPYAEFRDRETRSLSGGEKRKAALAGVFALDSTLVLLDEPTAALDGSSREKILSLIDERRKKGTSLVISTHSMEEAARYELVAVLKEGHLVACASPTDLFGPLFDEDWGIGLPWTASVARELRRQGLELAFTPLSANDLIRALSEWGNPTEAQNQGARVGLPMTGPPCLDQETKSRTAKKQEARKRRRGTGIEFFKNVTFGQFFDRPSFLRELNVGLKLLSLLALSLIALSIKSVFAPLGVLILTLATSYKVASVRPRELLRGLIPAWPYLLFLVSLQFIFSWPGDQSRVFLVLGPIAFTHAEALRSFLLISRLATLMALLTLFTATTELSELVRSVSRSLRPLSRFKVPVRELSLATGHISPFYPLARRRSRTYNHCPAIQGSLSYRQGPIPFCLCYDNTPHTPCPRTSRSPGSGHGIASFFRSYYAIR
ncbi:hypothetical protein MASR2M78_34880 [Treponema sp.]